MGTREIDLCFYDDDPGALIRAKGLLKTDSLRGLDIQDVRTVLVKDSDTAQGLAKNSSPNVNVIDFKLPLTNGVEIAREIRKTEHDNKMPRSVILINTAYHVLSSDHVYDAPPEIRSVLNEARDDGTLDGICEKGKDLASKIRKNLHMPLLPGVKGRGRVAYRCLQDLIKSDTPEVQSSFISVLNFGRSIPDDEFYKILEQKRERSKLITVDKLDQLSEATLFIDCSSRLRYWQVPRVIRYESRQDGVFFPDRRVVLPFELPRIEEDIGEIRADMPNIHVSNPVQYAQKHRLQCFRDLGIKIDPAFIYSPMRPDTDRIITQLEDFFPESEFPDQRYREFIKNATRYVIKCHGDGGLVVPPQYDDLFEDKLFVIIENIKINPEYQKNGLGKELMNKALELISSKNIKLISLNASPLNNQINSDKLLLFYQKFGFKIFKKQGKNVIMIKKI